MSNEWIGVDLDGTLAFYDHYRGPTHIGPPIIPMVKRVQQWIAKGIEVRIVTARASDPEAETVAAIEEWCRTNIGTVLPITNEKDFNMIELWDDRCVQVVPNTGECIEDMIWKTLLNNVK